MKAPLGSALLLLGVLGCARPAVPDPRVAAQQFAAAAERGDADAIHAMLTSASRRELGVSGTRKLVREARAELARSAVGFSSPRAVVDTVARVRYIDGELAELQWEPDGFKVAAASGLPARARTPAEALTELRQALARRSYPGLLRVLTRETQSALETDLRSLVTGLEDPGGLEIRVTGDEAEVTVPGGHVVRLKREAGFWKIDDFD